MTRGRVVIEEFASEVLRGNPAGDPHVRRIPVYLPPSHDAEPARRFPVLYVLAGFAGRGRMLLNDQPWSPPLDERLDALIASGRCGDAIVVLPDCFTRFGGSQYMDSTATGRYETHLVTELVPFIDARHRTLAGREHRGVAGKSSGGYGALRLGMRHADTFGAVACHSGDIEFEYCYRGELPSACRALQEAGGVQAFLAMFAERPPRVRDAHTTLNVIAMSACYSPDPSEPLGLALPFDLATGAFRPQVWARWLAHDPLRMLAGHAEALRSLRWLYLDCGTRDEYHLQLGQRLFAAELASRGIAHVAEEYPDGHRDVSYRYDVSLPRLVATLGG